MLSHLHAITFQDADNASLPEPGYTRLDNMFGMFACGGTVGPRWDVMWICLGSADAIISVEGNRSLRGKKYIQIRKGHCLLKNNLRSLYTQVQHMHSYSLTAVL